MQNLSFNDKVVNPDGTLSELGSSGGLTFRVNPEDPNKAQYKTPASDEWQDFSGGAGGGAALLWTNEAPATISSGWSVEIPELANYDAVIIETIPTNNRWTFIQMIPKTADACYPLWNSYDSRDINRKYIVNDSSVTISTSGTGDPPMRIWGINLNLN